LSVDAQIKAATHPRKVQPTKRFKLYFAISEQTPVDLMPVEAVSMAWIFLRSGAGKFPSWRAGDQP
jgi:hypothetical protein